MVYWLLVGYRVYWKVEGYMWQIQEENGYFEVKSLFMVNMLLWEQLGYVDKYWEVMLYVSDYGFVVKLMSCFFYIQMFFQFVKFYCDLFLRIVEFGFCYWNEFLGVLNGFFRF